MAIFIPALKATQDLKENILPQNLFGYFKSNSISNKIQLFYKIIEKILVFENSKICLRVLIPITCWRSLEHEGVL